MDARILDKVCRQVYSRFPEVRGQKPRVKPQAGDTYLLIFETQAATADGKIIHRTVRVTANSGGKILKASTSR